MQNKQDWLKRGKKAIIDLCQLYSAYVTSYRVSYEAATDEDGNPVDIAWTLSLSAFFDYEVLDAGIEEINAVYKEAPGLEGAEILALKLSALSNVELLDLLESYDGYIISLDEYCSDNCPVCLDEYLENDYQIEMLASVKERFSTQLYRYIAELIAKGAEKQRNHGFSDIINLTLFQDELGGLGDRLHIFEDDDEEIVEALACLVRHDLLINNVLAWCKDKNVSGAVHSGIFAFDTYWPYAVESAGR